MEIPKVKNLPKVAKAAISDELRQAFEDHLKETEDEKKRLDKISRLWKNLLDENYTTLVGAIHTAAMEPAEIEA